jgi:hypothetical protein
MKIKTSQISAFLIGITSFIPIYISENIEPIDSSNGYIVPSILLIYVVAIFLFVFGPMCWDKYRFIPKDGNQSAFQRVLAWFVGCVISVIVLGAMEAI